MIVSTVAGRIRVRSHRLKVKDVAQRVEAEASAIAGVTDARVNSAAGSLAVIYDTTAIDTEALEDRLEALCMTPAARAPRKSKELSRRVNQATKVGMMATLATSLAYGALGKKKQHIAFGTAFVALAGVHMFRYQSTLIR